MKIDPAEGCEHIDLSQVLPDTMELRRQAGFSESELLWAEMRSIRQEIRNDIARRATDPFDSLLAMETRGIGINTNTAMSVSKY